ncbi:transcription factor Pur-alpha 1-like [Juglans microcarpa x Juglans regia]|uniref:transcription factor Pur-alpha 1-like n=1 Tax=Juglans microcarpa x Juglans regia TaxID=2249226 RepID=UPI001B7EA0AF|nr:transcription factor Pur-alpha 1-like [Juglans microcarpa x Juglans regia]
MEGDGSFMVESKTFIFSKVAGNGFRITERNRKMALFLFINGTSASWVARMVEEALVSRRSDGFFRKLRLGNGVLFLQRHNNNRGYFLHLEEFWNGRRRGSLIVPEGVKGCGWEGFAYHLKKVTGPAGVFTEGSLRRGGVAGYGLETEKPPGNGVSYAFVLRSPTNFLIGGSSAMA